MYEVKNETARLPEILAGDHFTSQSCTVDEDLAEVVGSRKIVRAGTIFPANDETALGIIITDVDVTEVSQPAAYIDHGTVYLNRLPVAPDEDALPVLTGIIFREYK